MKKNICLIFYLIICIIIQIEKCAFKEIDNRHKIMIQNEKEMLFKLKENIEKNIQIINKIESKINIKLTLLNSIKENEACNDLKCVTILDINSNNKSINIFKFFSANFVLNEKLLNFHIFKLNKLDFANQKTKSKNFEEKFLIIFFTNKFLIVLNNRGVEITRYALDNFNINILQADFSNFDEDNSIILVSDNSELSLIIVDWTIIPIGPVDSDNYKIDIFIPVRKSITINNTDSINFLTQHKLHRNKYIIISFDNGNILIFNKDFEIKSSVTIKRKINKLFLNDGIMGIITQNEAIFLNVLGGNAVLLECSTYYNIKEAVYDNNNNFLFVVDEKLNFLIFNLKLSISKQNTNECGLIYRINIPSYLKNKKNNFVNLSINRNILYLVIEFDYVIIIDLGIISSKGLIVNEYALVKNFKSLNSNSFKISFLAYSNLNGGSNYILISEDSNFIIFKLKNVKIDNSKKNSKINFQENHKINNENYSDFWFFKISSSFLHLANNNIYFIYLIIIVLLSIVIIYYKKKKLKDDEILDKGNKQLNKKKFSGKDEEMLEDMWKSVQNLSKKTGLNDKSSKSKKLDDIVNDEDEYDDDAMEMDIDRVNEIEEDEEPEYEENEEEEEEQEQEQEDVNNELKKNR